MTPAAELVGRRAELQRLDAARQTVERERPWTVAIAGEPGIGKTRLISTSPTCSPSWESRRAPKW